MIGYIILGIFCYFLFMWVFRFLFIMMIAKGLSKMIEEKTNGLKNMMKGEGKGEK